MPETETESQRVSKLEDTRDAAYNLCDDIRQALKKWRFLRSEDATDPYLLEDVEASIHEVLELVDNFVKGLKD